MTGTSLPLIYTSVSTDTVRMRYANHADPVRATVWIDFQVPLGELLDPHNQPAKLGDVETALVAEVRLAALRYVRDVIAAENQRLQVRRGREN